MRTIFKTLTAAAMLLTAQVVFGQDRGSVQYRVPSLQFSPTNILWSNIVAGSNMFIDRSNQFMRLNATGGGGVGEVTTAQLLTVSNQVVETSNSISPLVKAEGALSTNYAQSLTNILVTTNSSWLNSAVKVVNGTGISVATNTSGNVVTYTITATGTNAASITNAIASVWKDGTPVAADGATNLNFIGAGVLVTNTSGKVDVAIVGDVTTAQLTSSSNTVLSLAKSYADTNASTGDISSGTITASNLTASRILLTDAQGYITNLPAGIAGQIVTSTGNGAAWSNAAPLWADSDLIFYDSFDRRTNSYGITNWVSDSGHPVRVMQPIDWGASPSQVAYVTNGWFGLSSPSNDTTFYVLVTLTNLVRTVPMEMGVEWRYVTAGSGSNYSALNSESFTLANVGGDHPNWASMAHIKFLQEGSMLYASVWTNGSAGVRSLSPSGFPVIPFYSRMLPELTSPVSHISSVTYWGDNTLTATLDGWSTNLWDAALDVQTGTNFFFQIWQDNWASSRRWIEFNRIWIRKVHDRRIPEFAGRYGPGITNASGTPALALDASGSITLTTNGNRIVIGGGGSGATNGVEVFDATNVIVRGILEVNNGAIPLLNVTPTLFEVPVAEATFGKLLSINGTNVIERLAALAGQTNNSILRTNTVTAAGSGLVVRQDGVGGITISNSGSLTTNGVDVLDLTNLIVRGAMMISNQYVRDMTVTNLTTVTNTATEFVATGGITLGGVRQTTWPAGGSASNAISTITLDGTTITNAATTLKLLTGSNTVVRATNEGSGVVALQINSSPSGISKSNGFGTNIYIYSPGGVEGLRVSAATIDQTADIFSVYASNSSKMVYVQPNGNLVASQINATDLDVATSLEVGTTNVIGAIANLNGQSNQWALVTWANSISNLVQTKQNGDADLTNWAAITTASKQESNGFLTAIHGLASKTFTNVPLGGTNISVRNAGGTNFIDTTGQLNNWASYPTTMVSSTASAVTNSVGTAVFGEVRTTNLYSTNLLISTLNVATQNVGTINYTNHPPGLQASSIALSNVTTAGNGTGMLTNNGSGTLGWMTIPAGGTGDAGGTNARQWGSVWLTNISTNAVFTNIVGTGVTTNGPAILQSATNYAASTANNVSNWVNSVSNSVVTVAGKAVLTNLVNSGVEFPSSKLASNVNNIVFNSQTLLVFTNSAMSNIVVNLRTNCYEISLTNNATLTNFTGVAAGQSLSTVLFITPRLINRGIAYPAAGGVTYDSIRFWTNANSPMWTTLTADVRYAISLMSIGTNVHATITEWK